MIVAFVTYPLLPGLHADDNIIAEYLTKRNIIVSAVSWDDPNVDWKKFDALVLRSMWDYFERPGEFNAWIEKIEAMGCVALNPVSVVRWNANKRYFDHFSKLGFKLPPYKICDQGSGGSLASILETSGWSKAVVKPVISGGSYNTWVVETSTAPLHEEQFQKLLSTSDLIVQKYVEEITSEGELSLIFFNKQFSHAIQKKPKTGDFRVQTQFGGTAVH